MAFIEQLSRRGSKIKHFVDDANPNLYQAIITLHDQHYYDGNNWQDVDESLVDDGVGGFDKRCDKVRHVFCIAGGGNYRWYPRRNITTEYVDITGIQYYSSKWRDLNLPAAVWKSTSAEWDLSNLYVSITNTWNRIKALFILKDDTAYTRLRFAITITGLTLSGWNLMSGSDVVGNIDPPTAQDANGTEVPITATYDGTYIEWSVDPTGAIYPITVDPIFTDGYGGDIWTAKDTALASSNTDKSFGSDTNIYIAVSSDRPGFIGFDCSSIPALATCDSAILSLYLQQDSAADRICYFHELLSANDGWIAGNSQDPATNNQSTWDYKNQTGSGSGTSWAGSVGAQTSGTDFVATAIGLLHTYTDPAGTEEQASLTPADVEDWFGSPNEHYGLRFYLNVAGGRYFHTAESSSTSYRPKLVVNYTLTGQISPTGIPSNEAFGTATIITDSVTVFPSGISSSEAFGISAIGHIWYVDNAASGSNNGKSWVDAWESFASINKGSISPGDIIYISGGSSSKTYFETLDLGSLSGSAGNFITFTVGANSPSPSSHDGTVIIDGGDVRERGILTQSTSHYIRVYGYDPSNNYKLVIQNMKAYSYGTGAAPGIECWPNGTYLHFDYIKVLCYRFLGISFDQVSYCHIKGCYFDGGNRTDIDGGSQAIYSIGCYYTIIEENVVIEGNSGVQPSHSDCIQSEDDKYHIIRNNYFQWIDGLGNDGCGGIYCWGMDGYWYFYNNVLIGCSETLNQVFQINGSSSGEIYILNNTIVSQNDVNGIVFHIQNVPDSNIIAIKNNILVSPVGYIYDFGGVGPSTPSKYANNCVHTPSTYVARIPGSSLTWAQWHDTNGYDANSITDDPDYDPNNEFRLYGTSPCIEAGADLSTYFTTDRDGTIRPIGTYWDIGPYEYDSEGTDIYPSGIGSAEAFGAVSVLVEGIYPTGIVSAEAFGTAAASLGSAPQFARPDSDVGTGGWTDQNGGTTDLWSVIDESTPNDSDYVMDVIDGTPDTLEVGLENLSDPGVHTGHFVRYRYCKDSATKTAQLKVYLMQGVTEIASWTHSNVSESWANAQQELTTEQAGNITDYTDLRLRFEAVEV